MHSPMPIFSSDRRAQRPERSLGTVLRSNRLQFAKFVLWTFVLLLHWEWYLLFSFLCFGVLLVLCAFHRVRGSPHGAPKAPKQKLRKTSNYIIRDPRPLKNNILHYPFFGHIMLF